MSMKKNVPANAKMQEMTEADGQNVPTSENTAKTNNFKDMMQEPGEQKAGRDINDRTQDPGRTDSGAEETNY